MHIKKLEFTSDYGSMLTEYNAITSKVPWLPLNQIGLTSRPGATDVWRDAGGSLYNRATGEKLGNECDFTVWNIASRNYIRQQIEALARYENTSIGRVRIMKLMPKCGLSVHKDLEIRYHYVFQTNKKSFFCYNESAIREDSDLPVTAVCYHIPQDGHWYKADTTKVHWVYNGGDTERIHLVVCGTGK